MFFQRFDELCKEINRSTTSVGEEIGIPKSTISYWRNNRKATPNQEALSKLSDYFDVSIDYLLGKTDIKNPSNFGGKYPAPNITEDYVTFPVIGEVAAGYDYPALEDWSGDTIDIPTRYLHGRKIEEFFVLSVKGDSMYPLYMQGDKVLILKQETLGRSGDIGVILYNGDDATLKKVEFVYGEDWMRLIPVNPQYQPKMISGPELESCRVLGIPKLLIREIND